MSGGQRWDAMQVVQYEKQGEKKGRWKQIGAGFSNKDGSISIQLDSLPLDGRIILQIPLSKEEKEARWGSRGGGGGGQREPQRGNWGNQGQNQGQPRQDNAWKQPRQQQTPPAYDGGPERSSQPNEFDASEFDPAGPEKLPF